MTRISTWSVLIIASMMVIGAFSTPLATPTAGSCGTGTTLVAKGGATALTDDPSTWTDVCVPDASLTADCYVYRISDGNCWCDSTGSFSSITILPLSGQTKPTKGCVPKSQQVLYADCTRTGTSKYDCACPTTGHMNKVDLVEKANNPGNTGDVPKGCSNFLIPNCKRYKLQALSNSPKDDFLCYECNGGATAFSGTTGAILIYDSARDPDLTGEGCPFDNTWQPTTCKTMKLNTNKEYECDCPTGEQRIVFTTTITQRISQGCVTTNSFPSVDTNCQSFTYSATEANIYCNTCKTNYKLLEFNGDGVNELFTKCVASSTNLIEGCSKYYATDTSAVSTTSALVCAACKPDYDQAPKGTAITILNDAAARQKMCLPKGRWSIDKNLCSSYKVPSANNLFLECESGQCAGNGGSNTLIPPCYIGTSPLVVRFSIQSCLGVPTTGQLGGFAVKIDGQTTAACIVSGIIQNCQTYSAVTTGVGSGECKACDPGYTVVDTDKSKPNADGTGSVASNKVCIPNAKLDPNNLCDAYSNVDFTCYRCKNGLTYDKVLKRCPMPTDASSGCDTAFTSGGKTICLSCKIGYTLIYPDPSASGVCVTSVEKCALLSASGCALCVNGFQLIDNKCIKLPPNCDKVNSQGVCTACKIGFAVNADGQCARTSQNTCPPGQVPSNGVCVSVQVSIAFCLRYTVDSKCEQCNQGKTPSADGLSCVNSDRPGAKPCPPNTSKVTYRRNPSNPSGDCVAVDVRCANARDDGFCISCKDNEYAHSDGKCYKIVAVTDGN